MRKKEKSLKEIITSKVWINAGIAFTLVFAGAFTSGEISLQALCAAFSAGVIAFAVQIREHINHDELKLFQFV